MVQGVYLRRPLLGFDEDVVVVIGNRNQGVDLASLGVHHDRRRDRGIAVDPVAGHVVIEQLGDEALQAGVDSELNAVAWHRVFRLQGLDEAALRVLLGGCRAGGAAQIGFVVGLDSGFAHGFVELVALAGQLGVLLFGLGADKPEHRAELVARRIAPAGADVKTYTFQVGGGLFEPERLVLGQVLAYRYVDVAAAIDFLSLDHAFDFEGGHPDQLFEAQVDLVALVARLREEFGQDDGGVDGYVFDQRLAVAVRDEPPWRELDLLRDVVFARTTGVVIPLDDLHTKELGYEDGEHHDDRDAQGREVPVRAVPGWAAAAVTCAPAIIEKAHVTHPVRRRLKERPVRPARRQGM